MRLVEFYDLDKDIYEDFVGSQKMSPFLQSWNWGEFQRIIKRPVWRFGIKQGNNLICTAQVISHSLPFDNSYLYMPRGPVFMPGLAKETQEKALQLILSKARDITYATKKENEIFIRLEPNNELSEAVLLPLPLIKQPDIQPANTWIVDLTKEEKELKKNMRSKTRYNINLAERKGVVVRQSTKKEDINKFLFLAKVTAARAGFSIWPDEYYIKMVDWLDKKSMISVWLAEYEDETLVANLVINFGDTVTYLHGGSANKHKEVMAPHLLQWEQIKWAKKQGFDYYDFWGIAPSEGKKAKTWYGITRFKKSFGGREINYYGTYDFVYRPMVYKIYNFIKKLRS